MVSLKNYLAILNYWRYIRSVIFGLLVMIITGIFRVFFIFLLFALVAKHHYSLASEASAPLQITSDDLIVDDKISSANFKGAVTVTFEDMILKTNELKVHYVDNKNKKSIDKIKIPGKLKAIKTNCHEVVVADSGEYELYSKQLVLYGNVKMQKDGNILITDKMIYIAKLKSVSNNSLEIK